MTYFAFMSWPAYAHQDSGGEMTAVEELRALVDQWRSGLRDHNIVNPFSQQCYACEDQIEAILPKLEAERDEQYKVCLAFNHVREVDTGIAFAAQAEEQNRRIDAETRMAEALERGVRLGLEAAAAECDDEMMSGLAKIVLALDPAQIVKEAK